jgi:hypothetical protein
VSAEWPRPKGIAQFLFQYTEQERLGHLAEAFLFNSKNFPVRIYFGKIFSSKNLFGENIFQ